jgi:fucose permease
VILFFTCASAVVAPLAMGAVSDASGDIAHGFWLAAALAVMLFAGLVFNWLFTPTRAVLQRQDVTDYSAATAR